MKKQNALWKGLRFSLLLLVFLGGSLMVTFGQASRGDVDGSGTITIVDALMVAQYTVGISVNINLTQADSNADGNITIVDALIIAQYYVNLITSIPPGGGNPTNPPATTPPGGEPTTIPGGGPSTGTHITGNPFVGADWYKDPVWGEKARDGGGASIADEPTMIWMDRISAITEGNPDWSLEKHLDNCVTQGANLFQVSIYDLPNRDCAAAASSGELLIANGDMARYKSEYIDVITAIFDQDKYSDIRIICLVEIDSLPNLITNTNLPLCQEAAGDDGYVEGVTYAIDKLTTVPNVYCYIDIAHSGWLGWDDNLGPMCDLLSQVGNNLQGGKSKIDGFASNTCNYTPLEEVYLTDPNKQVGGQAIKTADFYEWNAYFDEKDFIIEMHRQLTNRGFSNFGMIHDTSRNGWGGSSYGRSRPTKASSSSDLNTYVNESKIDRRYHRGNWCNQEGGIGFRPQASPFSQCDAYVWIKPPGESDGISYAGPEDPNDPAKTFDDMCDPNGQNTSNSSYGTGAMDAPHAGRWNQEQFDALLRNAYPSL
jgi:cellulose 1,4-beta-cellobiosidase